MNSRRRNKKNTRLVIESKRKRKEKDHSLRYTLRERSFHGDGLESRCKRDADVLKLFRSGSYAPNEEGLATLCVLKKSFSTGSFSKVTYMFRVTLNFRDDISALHLHHFEGGRHLKERSKNTRECAAFVLRSPIKQNSALKKQQAFRF